MNNFDEEVKIFLNQFEVNANVGDAEEAEKQFADVFLAADPGGARAVPSSMLMTAVPQRKKLFESVGRSVTKLASVKQIALDDRYVLLRTEWMVKFDREFEQEAGRSEELTLRSTFLVHRSDDGLKIVLYLSHQDLMSVLREKGVLPDKA
jgi:hypothetical protein